MGRLMRPAERLAAADDRDLVHRVGVLEGGADQRVAHLVEGDGQLLLLADHPALALRAGDDAGDRLLEVVHDDDLAVAARGEDRRLVDQVGEVGAAETRGLLGEHLEVDAGVERLVARVHLEDRAAAADVGAVEHDVPVEAAGAEQRGVEDVGPVGGRDHDDVLVGLEPVHLDEELVEGLLALVVAAAEARATLAADGVDLVDEDDAGRVLLGLVEEVAHAAGADADEHLDELRAADAEERHARLAGDGLAEQRLAGARRADQQHALGDARADGDELVRVLEELDDLVQLLLGLVDAGDVDERDRRLVTGEQAGAAAAEGQRLVVAALGLPEDPEQDQRHQPEEDRGWEG